MCCASYNNGEGKAFDNPTTCLTQCPGVLIEACKPNCEENLDLPGSAPTCLCGDEIIKKEEYCCLKLETGYIQTETCQRFCASATEVPSCNNLSCQLAETKDCLCGSALIEAGQYCCAASDKGYSKQSFCRADLKCRVVESCNQLYGIWCLAGYSCEGNNLTLKASDSAEHPDQVCCSGECVAGAPGETTPTPGTPTPGTPGDTISSWTTIENPLAYDTFEKILGEISKFLIQIGSAIAGVMFLIAGFMFVTAGGNPEKVQSAKKMILYTIIGLAIIILASGLVAVLKSVIGVTS